MDHMAIHDAHETSHEDAVREAIASELRAEQGRARISDRAISTATGLPPRTVGRYLNAETPIPVQAYMDITGALNVEGGALLDRVYRKLREQR